MAFDFPNSPLPGAIYTVAGITYVWDGIAWNAQAGSPPKTAQARNYLTNPAMQTSQENGFNAAPQNAFTAAYYQADQWYARWDAPGAGLSAGLVPTAAADPLISPNYATLWCGVAKAVLAANDYHMLTQPIEGAMLKDFCFGTPKAKPAVLAFMAKHPVAGTYSARLVSSGLDKSFVAPFTLDADQWKRIVVPIPAMPSGTWATGIGKGAQLDFCNVVGSFFLGVAGWQDGNKYGVPGQTNGIAVGSKSLAIGDVGLYLDPDGTGIAPPFEVPDFANDLNRAMRYWLNRIIVVESAAEAVSTTLPTAMRTQPTVSGGGAGFVLSLGYSDIPYFYQTARATQNLTFNARM